MQKVMRLIHLLVALLSTWTASAVVGVASGQASPFSFRVLTGTDYARNPGVDEATGRLSFCTVRLSAPCVSPAQGDEIRCRGLQLSPLQCRRLLASVDEECATAAATAAGGGGTVTVEVELIRTLAEVEACKTVEDASSPAGVALAEGRSPLPDGFTSSLSAVSFPALGLRFSSSEDDLRVLRAALAVERAYSGVGALPILTGFQLFAHKRYLESAELLLHEYLRLKGQDITQIEGNTGIEVGKVRALASIFADPRVETVCEIGFNAGHSALNALLVNDGLRVLSFDLGEHNYGLHALSFWSLEKIGSIGS